MDNGYVSMTTNMNLGDEIKSKQVCDAIETESTSGTVCTWAHCARAKKNQYSLFYHNIIVEATPI